MSEEKRISLVLGSGGARGHAHIGVIEALLARGYRIESIAGSSMGALIGGLYAAGKLEAYKEWVLDLKMMGVLSMLDLTFSKAGVIKGGRVLEVLDGMIGDQLIEDLPIRYTAVATDLKRQKEVWMTKGPLRQAIRASIAVPSIFTPAEFEGRMLLDGGILNPVPVAATVSDMTDLTIAVNLSGESNESPSIPLPEAEVVKRNSLRDHWNNLVEKAGGMFGGFGGEEELREDMSFFEIWHETIETMQNTLANYRLAGYPPDLTINIPKDACRFQDFHKAYELITLGRIIATRALEQFEKRNGN